LASLPARSYASSAATPEVAGTLPTIPPFDHTPLPYDGPSKEEVMEMRQKYLNPTKFLHFKKPVMIVEGKMQYLYDETGRRFLDVRDLRLT
jgi:alanine-glyoxylate transaminase/(R)-3-amino-2-methylpropionate-pyruvate transaminase